MRERARRSLPTVASNDPDPLDAILDRLAERLADKLMERLGDPSNGEHAVGDWLDTEHAAHYLGLRPATLEVWRAQGEGPSFRKVRRRVRYRRADLDLFIKANRGSP